MVSNPSDHVNRAGYHVKLFSFFFGSPQETDRATLDSGQAELDGLSHFRQRLAQDGVDQKVLNTIMQAWRKSTHKQNKSYFKKIYIYNLLSCYEQGPTIRRHKIIDGISARYDR